jgi:preprotein translocase subunit YajC
MGPVVSVAFAQGTGGGAASPLAGLPFILLLVGIFYVLLIRPEQKKRREHEAMLASLKRNDRVTMSSGIHGRIMAMSETTVTVEIAPKVHVEFDRGAVERVHLPDAREKERGKA